MPFTAEVDDGLDRWGRIQLPWDPSQRTELAIDFVQLAELDLQIPEEWSIVRGPDASEPLPPSITKFVIEDEGGNRHGLVLQLQPAVARTVTMRKSLAHARLCRRPIERRNLRLHKKSATGKASRSLTSFSPCYGAESRHPLRFIG